MTDWGKNPPPVSVDWHRDHHGRWVGFVSVATREEVVVELMSHGARITVGWGEEVRSFLDAIERGEGERP